MQGQVDGFEIDWQSHTLGRDLITSPACTSTAHPQRPAAAAAVAGHSTQSGPCRLHTQIVWLPLTQKHMPPMRAQPMLRRSPDPQCSNAACPQLSPTVCPCCSCRQGDQQHAAAAAAASGADPYSRLPKRPNKLISPRLRVPDHNVAHLSAVVCRHGGQHHAAAALAAPGADPHPGLGECPAGPTGSARTQPPSPGCPGSALRPA